MDGGGVLKMRGRGDGMAGAAKLRCLSGWTRWEGGAELLCLLCLHEEATTGLI